MHCLLPTTSRSCNTYSPATLARLSWQVNVVPEDPFAWQRVMRGEDPHPPVEEDDFPRGCLVPVHGLTRLRSLVLEGMSYRALRSFLRGLSPDSLPQLTDITMETVRREWALYWYTICPGVYCRTSPGCSTRFP